MGLFSFFKKKKPEPVEEPKPEVVERINGNEVTPEVKDKMMEPYGKKLIKTFKKNGLNYCTYEITGGFNAGIQFDAPAYDETFATIVFISKYPTIKQSKDGPRLGHRYLESWGIDNPEELHELLEKKGIYTKPDSKGKCTISKVGQKFIKDNQLRYDWFNTDPYSSFDSYKKKRQTMSAEDIAKENEEETIKSILEAIANDKDEFGRFAYNELAGYYKDKKDQLVCYLKELLIDLSGAMLRKDWKHEFFDYKLYKEMYYGKNKLVPYTGFLKRTLPKYKDVYDESLIDKVFEIEKTLPFNACDKQMFTEIAEMCIDDSFDAETQRDYFNKINNRIDGFAAKLIRKKSR